MQTVETVQTPIGSSNPAVPMDIVYCEHPATELAKAVIGSERNGLIAVSEMLADLGTSSSTKSPKERADLFLTMFAEEMAKVQFKPDSASAKNTRKSRKSDLNAIFKAWFGVGADSFAATFQPMIDDGTITGLQSFAKACRAAVKPSKSEADSAAGAEGADEAEGAEPYDPETVLVDSLNLARKAAKDLNRDDIVESIDSILSRI